MQTRARIAAGLQGAALAVATRAYAIVAFALPFAIYARSASSDPASWDTAEMQGVPYILGIAHPTGFPFYTLLGWLYAHVVVIGTVAFRMNLFAGACVAAASLAGYLICRELRVLKPVALVCVLWFAVTHVAWVHASRAEVHDLALALCAFCVLCCLRWMRGGRRGDFYAAALLFGLALATHPFAIWLAPGLALALILKRRSVSWARVGKGALIVVACACLYLYLPIRSETVALFHEDPAARLTGVNSSIFWDYNEPRTWSGFKAEVSGSQFSANSAVAAAFDPHQYQPALWNWLSLVNDSYGAFVIPFALFGLVRCWQRDRALTAVLLVTCLGVVPFSYAYPPEGDGDRYRMLPILLVAVLAACTCIDLREKWQNLRALAATCFALLMAVSTFINNQGTFGYRGPTGGRNFIDLVAARVPRGAIVTAGWVDATSLAYGAYVDRSLPDRIVVSEGPGASAPSFAQWLTIAPVYIIGSPDSAFPTLRVQRLPDIDTWHALFRVLGPARPLPTNLFDARGHSVR